MSWPVASTSSGPALPIDLQFNQVASKNYHFLFSAYIQVNQVKLKVKKLIM